jgi:hypothetical protein
MSRSFQVQEKWQMQSFSTTTCIDRNINFHPRKMFNPFNLKALSLKKANSLLVVSIQNATTKQIFLDHLTIATLW